MKESPISPQKERSLLGAAESEHEGSGQMKAAPAFKLTAGDAPPTGRKPGGGGLPEDLVNGFLAATGHDLSDVKVHYNSDKPAQVGALAYAKANDIYLGPGQEKHLDHEAAHLVQQREGRVQPNAEVNGMAVNNSKTLESEADSLAAHARQMKTATGAGAQAGSYQSKALQMRADTPGAMQLKGGVAQMKLDTQLGEWYDDTYSVVNEGGMFGADIKLRFKPKAGVDAEVIGLVQQVRSKRNGMNRFPNGDNFYSNRAIASKDAKTVDASARILPGDATETDETGIIDQYKDVRHPMYAVDSAPGTDADLNQSLPATGDITKAGPNGQHAFRYSGLDGKIKEQDGFLKDTPKRVAFPNSGQMFEVTALATKGAQAGMYYGSVRWGWRADASSKVSLVPFEKVSDGVPSSTFLAAAKVWNGSKTEGGLDNLKLPVDTVFINAAATPMFKDAAMTVKDKDLPANTRMVNTSCTLQGSYGMKIVDGPDIGKIGFVDQTKIQRER